MSDRDKRGWEYQKPRGRAGKHLTDVGVAALPTHLDYITGPISFFFFFLVGVAVIISLQKYDLLPRECIKAETWP